MKQLPKVLYHVSPDCNRSSISRLGVLPDYAPTDAKRRAIWAVESQAVIWALMHVSVRHSYPINELVIWTMPVNDLWRCHAGPIWYSLDKIYPLNYRTSSYAIDDYAKFLQIIK